MEIGLYNAKYPFRKMIQFLLTYCKNTDPNHISLALLPIGMVTAIVYFNAPDYPALYWLGIVLIFVRMVVGTLDGLVAETYQKQTANGTILNRLTPEAADMMLLLAIILTNMHYFYIGLFAITICWGVSYCGLIGLAGGKSIRSVGPAGQTDRLVALMLCSALQFFNLIYHWDVDCINIFLWWVIIGGFITISLRCYQVLAWQK